MSTEGILGPDDMGDPFAYESSLGRINTAVSQSFGDVDWMLGQLVQGNLSPAAVKQALLTSTTLSVSSKVTKNNLGSYVDSITKERSLRRRGVLPPFRFSFRNYRDLVRPVKFYSPKWKETAKTGMVVLPVPPETIEVSGGNAPEEVVAASGISFSHAGPYTPLTFTMEGFFPHITDFSNVPEYVPTDTIRRGLYSPASLCGKFIQSMRAGQPLVFSIIQPGSEEQRFMNSYTVVVMDFKWSFKAGHGKDRFWSMTLKEWFPQHVIQTGRKVRRRPGNTRPDNNQNNRAPVPAGRVYTIVAGDTLPKIADKTIGNASRWREIYTLNLTELNKQLKARNKPLNNPNLIYPGTKLIIPA
jgi:hypothetical protein